MRKEEESHEEGGRNKDCRGKGSAEGKQIHNACLPPALADVVILLFPGQKGSRGILQIPHLWKGRDCQETANAEVTAGKFDKESGNDGKTVLKKLGIGQP